MARLTDEERRECRHGNELAGPPCPDCLTGGPYLSRVPGLDSEPPPEGDDQAERVPEGWKVEWQYDANKIRRFPRLVPVTEGGVAQ